ncbi:MAG: hypothetical protein M0Z50_15170 [Planctomycetia bacterium]|nr:hypothetical protein [Planctomycetia bacterium]
MKKTATQLAGEDDNIEFELANELSPSSRVTVNGDVIHTPAQDNTPEIKRLRRIADQVRQEKLLLKKSYNNNVVRVALVSVPPCARRTQERRGAEGKKQAAAGDSPADPEPPRPGLAGEAELANQLCISKKTVQNIYSRTPHLLPPAIQIPGARGPRWTQAAIDKWLSERPKHTPKPAPQPTKKKVGRPRIARKGKRGAA